MIKCPFCNASDTTRPALPRYVNLFGKYWCARCFNWFNDCCPLSDKPVNAKLADAALDSLPVGRYRTPEVDTFRAEFEKRFPALNYNFIVTMQEIGNLGQRKYGDNCIEARIKRGDTSRQVANGRVYAREIAKHSRTHFEEYLDGIKHDVYNTKRHQLGAAAFNPMMEFSLAELEGEPCASLEITNR